MSSEHSDRTVSDQLPAAGATTSPELTIEGSGPARFERQISADEAADLVATHEQVDIDVSVTITDPATFETIVPTYYQSDTPIGEVLRSLFDRYDQYDGYTPVDIEEWSLTISGSVVDWQETVLALVDSAEGKRRYNTLLSYYRTGLLDEGATLALFDLLTEFDISKSNYGREYLVDELGSGNGSVIAR